MNTGEPLIRQANKTLQEQSVLLGKDVANQPERQLSPGTVLNRRRAEEHGPLAELSSTFGLVNSYEHDCLAMPSSLQGPTPSCR